VNDSRPSTLAALDNARNIATALPGLLFAIAYGSHARGKATARSDLDLLFVFNDMPALSTIRSLVRSVARLHAVHGLPLDHEIAYETKTWATRAQLAGAIALDGFERSPEHGKPHPTPVTGDAVYLHSAAFKARLILNALTSPHVFLDGDHDTYSQFHIDAGRALTRLATYTSPGTDPSIADLVEALVAHPESGATGQDWLGYVPTDSAHLYALMAANLPVTEPHAMPRPQGPGRHSNHP
jgi:predicted nucleotidyltransferase